jgi:Domain of unknown function (DUF1707)/Cell wall-active antibiotics response 4TMS YvqF
VVGSHEPADERVPALRASDADRERVVLALRDGAAEGRLTFDELAQRVELAYTAVSGEELERLVADLPEAAPQTAPERPVRKRQRWNVAVMGGCDRRGRWRPAPRSVALAVMGGVGLDLRDATIEGDELVITAIAFMGGIDVIVPDGVEVQLTGFAFMGGNDHRPGTAPLRPGTPVVHVRAFSVMGGIDVKVKRSRNRS